METNQRQNKETKRGFIWKWIFCSGIGGATGIILFSLASMIMFFGISDAPKPSGLPPVPMNMALKNGLVIGTILAFALGLPPGIAQWILLAQRFKNPRMICWILVYSIGLLLPISVIVTITLYFKTFLTIPVFLLAGFTAGVIIGSTQWLILWKYIARGFWLVPANLIAIAGFLLCFARGGSLDELGDFILFPLGGFLGYSLYGAMTGSIILQRKEQFGNIANDAARGTRQ